MYEETKKAPAIRFQGFTDDWEQRKLGEVFFQTSKYVNPKESNLELWSLTVENGLTPKTERYNREFLVKKEDQFKSVDHNEFIYNPMNMTLGAVDLNLTGKTVAVSGYYITMLSKDGFDSKYFSIWLKSPLAIKMYKLYATGSLIERQRVQFPTLSQIKSSVPQIEEQTKIGSFFKQLDDTIALHQRMSDKQKKLKANLLQMMFPRNGEKIPEVRLAGFAEDWSQRTLEDISDKVTEKNKAREFTETLTNSAEYGIISQSDYFDKDISNINNIDGYYVVRPDDFVYNPRISNFAPVGPIKRNNLNRIGIMSPLYYVFRPKRVDHTFLEKYFETSYWHIFMKMNGDSGARADRFAIKDTILKEMPIPYPIKEEQVKIGIFFNQLDKSIVLHQEKIAHLKVLKSTLLNKMFI